MAAINSVERTSTTHSESRTCCDRFLAGLNQIKQWACSFFQWLFCCSRAEPTKRIAPTKVLSTIDREAERLTQDFLNQKKTHNASGYRVNVPLNGNKFRIEIEPRGTKNSTSIPFARRSAEESAQRFGSTRQKAVPLCEELTKRIASFNMYAIFSPSNNLLLIPDTEKGLKAADYPHLFALNEAQLRNVFSATLTVNAYLQSHFSDYKPYIGAHVGCDGGQEEGLLHMRFEHLPQQITALNK
jgi:hypothetical protein